MQTIHQLVEKIIEKDHNALEELYDRYHLFVWTFSTRLCGSSTTCEKLVQATFSHVWENPHDFYTSTTSSFPSYLLHVAKSKFSAFQQAG